MCLLMLYGGVRHPHKPLSRSDPKNVDDFFPLIRIFLVGKHYGNLLPLEICCPVKFHSLASPPLIRHCLPP